MRCIKRTKQGKKANDKKKHKNKILPPQYGSACSQSTSGKDKNQRDVEHKMQKRQTNVECKNGQKAKPVAVFKSDSSGAHEVSKPREARKGNRESKNSVNQRNSADTSAETGFTVPLTVHPQDDDGKSVLHVVCVVPIQSSAANMSVITSCSSDSSQANSMNVSGIRSVGIKNNKEQIVSQRMQTERQKQTIDRKPKGSKCCSLILFPIYRLKTQLSLNAQVVNQTQSLGGL